MIYQRALENHGFTIELVTDGVKGMERLVTFKPDAVLLDLMMPKLGGVGVLQALRAQEAFRDLPVIVMTNAYVSAFVDQAMKEGANGDFDKSKDTPATILGLLHSLLAASVAKRATPPT